MSDDVKFTCEVCGAEFDPDPDTMQEVHISGDCPCCEGGLIEEQAGEMLATGEAFTAEQLAAMNEFELRELGLTPEQRDKVLAGEKVAIGGMCICRECQDREDKGAGGT